MKSPALLSTLLGAAILSGPGSVVAAQIIEADICVFGGTSSGIAAAVQAQRMGRTVVIANPSRYLGGLTTGGLSATDIGNKAAVGGISREFYHRIAQHYARDAAWKLESREDYFGRRASGQSKASDLSGSDATMWTFEPSVAEKVFFDMLREAKIPVWFDQRLASVVRTNGRIAGIAMENGHVFRARMYIDATYEGDLMAKAGVGYHVGREANSIYGETLNGIRAQTPKHQFNAKVDPYRKPGDPSSGLLPFIQSGDGGMPGDGDKRVQTYNYRLCFTTNASNRLPVAPPPGYDPARYEVLARYIEALVAAGHIPQLREFWNPIWMPNGKTDINNNGGFSTDFIGANYDYPEADYDTRAKMAREHENYTRGFITFMASCPRVPAGMREEMRLWGPARDEFPDTGGWPREMYVREARRMISDYVMTENHCRGKEVAGDSIGLAAYNMDSHNCQRIVKDGHIENEGDVQVPPMKPYPISYRAMVPKAGECSNLFVPVCLSSTHIAYGSIRMEPVFMLLGQSAATAACLALDSRVPVQELDYPRLRARLLADRQVLEWTGGGSASPSRIVDPKSLPGIVLDDRDGRQTGRWIESSALGSHVGGGYIHDGDANKGLSTLVYTPDIPRAGQYEIIVFAPPSSNRATNVPVTVNVTGGVRKTIMINQRDSKSGGAVSIGRFSLEMGRGATVTISNEGTQGHVIADGIQFLPATGR
jgi:hypothetical protein